MAPVARNLTPGSGQVGNTATIQGDQLDGTSFEIKFGTANAPGASNPGRSDNNIKVAIPNKTGPGEPNDVVVTVKVGGVEATYPNGPLRFSYALPQPVPTLTSVSPSGVARNTGFVMTIGGSNFVIGQRAPVACYAFAQAGAQELTVSTNLVGSPTPTTASFFFLGLGDAGDYRIALLFSDASSAEMVVPGLVAGGTEPNIERFETVPFPAPAGQEFTITLFGTDFTNAAGRKPTAVLIEQNEAPVDTGVIDQTSITATRFSALLPRIAGGAYTVKATFSGDGSVFSDTAPNELDLF